MAITAGIPEHSEMGTTLHGKHQRKPQHWRSGMSTLKRYAEHIAGSLEECESGPWIHINDVSALTEEIDKLRENEKFSNEAFKGMTDWAVKYESALRLIASDDSDCGCSDHSSEDCCNQNGVFCPRCIAAASLAR
jgi:hypothetical protein